MKKLIALLLCMVMLQTYAQLLFTPGASVGANTTGNTTGVGIGTNNPSHRFVVTANNSLPGTAQFFTNTNNSTQSVQVLDGWGNPALRFNNDGTSFEVRGTSSFLELIKASKATNSGFRILWDNTNDYGVGAMGNNIFNSSQTNQFRLFVDKGIKTELFNPTQIGIGTTIPQARIEIVDPVVSFDPLMKMTGLGQPSLIHAVDNTVVSMGAYSKYGLLINRLYNSSSCGAYVRSTLTGVHAIVEQTDNTSSSTGIVSQTGLYRTDVSSGVYMGADIKSVKANDCYGVRSIAGDAFMCSNYATGGQFFAYGYNATGIYAKAIQCGASGGALWAGYFDGKTFVKDNLEIDAVAANTSGLKFTQLNSSSPVSPTAPSKVLSVDANGNVILVSCCSSGGGGTNYWSQNGSDIYNNNSGNVGIGTSTPSARLHVTSGNDYSFNSINTKVVTSMSVPSPIAVSGTASSSVGIGLGGYFDGGNTGVYGTVIQNLDQLTSTQMTSVLYDLKGVDGYAENTGANCPRWAIGTRGMGFVNNNYATAIGLYGFAYAPNTSNEWALYADGRTYSLSGTWTASDERLKTNVKNITSALDIINRLTPKSYEYRNDGGFAQKQFVKGETYGFLAQDLEKVIPAMVTEAPMIFNNADKDKSNDYVEMYKAVNYEVLIPVLTQAIKEQQVQIEALQQQLGNGGSNQNFPGSLPAGDTDIRLYQNNPNPFNTETRIGYYLPENIQNGRILVFDLQGKQVKSFTLDKKGNAELVISGNELQAGMYIYTLVADNKVIDSKRMILTEE